MTGSCKKEQQVLRRYPQLSDRLAAHAETCLICSRAVQQLDEMAELSRETAVLDPGQEDQLRDNVLARAEQLLTQQRSAEPNFWRSRTFAAAAVLATVLSGVGAWALLGNDDSPLATKRLTTPPPLAAATSVDKSEPDVATAPEPAPTRSVRVHQAGRQPRRPEPNAPQVVASAPTVTPKAEPAPTSTPAVTVPTDEQLYEQAWSALREKSYAEAARRFLAVTVAASDPGLLEDAQFWHGASQALAGQPHEAVWTLQSFLAQYPSSARAHEAASILGWQLLALSEIDAAEPVLTFATHSSDPAIRDQARAGLAKVWQRHLQQ